MCWCAVIWVLNKREKETEMALTEVWLMQCRNGGFIRESSGDSRCRGLMPEHTRGEVDLRPVGCGWTLRSVGRQVA